MQTFLYDHPKLTSLKTFQHWSQIVRLGDFKKFDYGLEGNREKYGMDTPPLYDIAGIKQSGKEWKEFILI